MRPFGEAKLISGHQTLQLMRRPYGVKGSMCVRFYYSGGCCEEILVSVKIASSDREIINTKTIAFFPSDRQKDLCPSPTSFQSTSANLGFLYWESSKKE
ncbi:hypothetical protein ACOSQ2_019362 [Xanthoceras sorbifolium]